MQKYNSEEQQFQNSRGASHLDIQMQTVQTIWLVVTDQTNYPVYQDMRRFRAQRNFYIAGFALFLCLVIKRLVGLISANAGLQV